jgi:hypothetical protein
LLLSEQTKINLLIILYGGETNIHAGPHAIAVTNRQENDPEREQWK